MLKALSKLLLVLTLAGCGAGGLAHAIPPGGKADAVGRRPASTGAGVTVAVHGSGYNFTSYAVNFATKPTSTSDFLVCYVIAVQATGTLNFTGGPAWTIAGAVTSSEPMQQILAYRQATAADITGQTYTATTTTAGNHTGWVCDIVSGGFTLDQIVTASQDVINGSQTLGTLTPSVPGEVVLALLGIDGAASETFTTPGGYTQLSTNTSGPDTWNFSKIKAATDSGTEQPAGTSAYAGAQPHALSAVVALKPVPTPPPAPPALIEAVSAHAGNQSTSATSVSCAYTAVPANGQYLLAYAGVDSGKAFATPAGWSLVGNLQVSGAQSLYVFEKIASGESSATYTFTQTGTVDYMTVTCSRWNGVDPVSPRLLTSSVVDTNSAASPQVGPALTPGSPNTVAVGYWLTNDDARTITGHTAGWTQDASLTAVSGFYSVFEMQHVAATSGTPYAPSVSLSGHDLSTPTNLMVTLVLNPAGGSATPTPTPTPAPTPTPTPAPYEPQNGVDDPANAVPYAPGCSGSVLNCPMPHPDTLQPILLANSAAIIAALDRSNAANEGPLMDFHTQEAGAGYDYGRPRYTCHVAQNPACVQVSMACKSGEFCFGSAFPTSMLIPPNAQQATGSDHHVGVIQPDGTEMSLWLVSQNNGPWARPWKAGDELEYGGGGNCTNYFTGSGFNYNGQSPTAGDACGFAGAITASQLNAHHIPHATFGGIGCAATAYVYPGNQQGDHRCSGSNAVPLGAHFWLPWTNAYIDSLGLSADQTTLLKQLHEYGEYILDTGIICGNPGNPPCPSVAQYPGLGGGVEEDQMYDSFGVTSPMIVHAQNNGWGAIPINALGPPYHNATRYIMPALPTNVLNALMNALVIVDPCYAQGTC